MENGRALRWLFSTVLSTALGVGAPARAEPATWRTESVDPDEELPTGKRVAPCPNLRLPASSASLKVPAPDGSVYGSGLTGQRPSIAKCVNDRVVWQRPLNTIPTAIEGLWSGALYAGMTPGKKVALGVGEVDKDGKEKWFRKIDTPGDEFGAVAATGSGKSGFAFYVLSGSTGKLAGQPENASGHRFLAAFAPHDPTSGKQSWVKQSPDFGRAPDPRSSGEGGTPAALAADGDDGVYVLSAVDPKGVPADRRGQACVAKLTKFSARGRQLWQRVICVDTTLLKAPSFRGTLRAMAVDPDGSSIYVAGEAVVGTNQSILVMRLDRLGTPRWTKVASLQYGTEWKSDDGATTRVYGDLEEVRGLAVSGATLLVLAAYGNEFNETWEPEDSDEEEMLGMGGGSRDYNEVAAVASFDSLHGKLQWARQYEGLGPEYNGASAFQPSGIDLLPDGTVAITGSEDIWVAQQGQRFEDVPVLLKLNDSTVHSSADGEPPSALGLEFYEQLRAAVKRGDKNWVADHTVFPLCCTYPGGKRVPDKASFLKRYDEIFNTRVLDSVDYTKVDMVYRDRDGGGLTTSDSTLHFDWVEAKGARKAGYHLTMIDNEIFGGEAEPAATETTASNTPVPVDERETTVTAKTEQKPEAEDTPTSKREKIKSWFKEQHREAVEKSKQEREQGKK